MSITRGIGLTLTIAGLILGVWFVQMLWAPGPAALDIFVVAAIALAMISVGLRYTFKSPRKNKS